MRSKLNRILLAKKVKNCQFSFVFWLPSNGTKELINCHCYTLISNCLKSNRSKSHCYISCSFGEKEGGEKRPPPSTKLVKIAQY